MRRCGPGLASLFLTIAAGAETVAPTPGSPGLWCFTPGQREAQASYERALCDAIDTGRLRELHEMLAARPHPAGSEGDLRVIEHLRREFEAMGLEVEVQWLDLYLAEPQGAELELLVSDGPGSTPAARERLAIKESPVDGDAFSADPELDFGWNAYSGSGVAEGEVVYVNYGRKEDFQLLQAMGVDLAGKIALARYGGNYRGYKAKFAEEAGAVGLVMYTDPEDAGYVRGLMYPEGGFANETQIQRGSIKTLPYPGDPLTPGWAATPDAERLDPDDLMGLPTIPVQPIGWASAQRIMERMTGDPVPRAWQGAMPLNYRLTSGERVRVRIRVDQPRRLMRTANVVATLRGSEFPGEEIIVGGHHDAWTHGAGDPLAGLIIVLETARVFAERAEAGDAPRRTLRFAGWAAEEFGLIGSTEWVEANAARLREQGVAYLNLDMSAMGPRFWSSAAPTLKRLVVDASRDAPQSGEPSTPVFAKWAGRSGAENGAWPAIGSLGGGSDHVAFYCHAGVPAMAMGAGGAPGVSYHSAYDNLAWYHKIVGDDYEPAAMIARVACVALARLANAAVLPIDPTRYERDLRAHLSALETRAGELGVEVDVRPLRVLVDAFAESAAHIEAVMERAAAGAGADPRAVARRNRELRMLERVWLSETGLPGRPWYRSLFVAPDQDSGYSAWMLPALRHAVERLNRSAFRERVSEHEVVLTELAVRAKRIETIAELLARSVAEPIEGEESPDAAPTRWDESGHPSDGRR